MSEYNPQPDSAIAALDQSSDLYALYSKLYEVMHSANQVEGPGYIDNPPYKGTDAYGDPVIDIDEVQEQLEKFTDVQMKNAAYKWANAIISVIGAGGSGSTSTGGFVSRNGDSMVGMLTALYGFQAGAGHTKIFETVLLGSDETPYAIVSGNLRVTGETELQGKLNLANTGIWFGSNQVIYYDNGHLKIDNQDIDITGDIALTGKIQCGDVLINNTGIYWGDKEFYHSGNSNIATVDWTMKDAYVAGNLTVDGSATLKGRLTALQGFDLGEGGGKLLYSDSSTVIGTGGEGETTYFIKLDSDLHIVNNHGIKFDDKYIVSVRDTDKIVSFSAPKMRMNLGDYETSAISLQADIYSYDYSEGAANNIKIISKEGAGYFPKSLKAAHGGSILLETFSTDSNNRGVLFPYQIRLGSTGGPGLYADNDILNFIIPYLYDGAYQDIAFNLYYALTTSPFRNQSLTGSATLHFNTGAEFFCFDKPVEAAYFAIKSELYKTRLMEDALFFDDGKFIEGVTDGLRHAGNSYFDATVSSPSFASGFAGYGWAVKEDSNIGGPHATFDALTVRKKMRVYELEVQKISCTNGSLWVSDSCSGDEVRALN